jgi:hypothetical protein
MEEAEARIKEVEEGHQRERAQEQERQRLHAADNAKLLTTALLDSMESGE